MGGGGREKSGRFDYLLEYDSHEDEYEDNYKVEEEDEEGVGYGDEGEDKDKEEDKGMDEEEDEDEDEDEGKYDNETELESYIPKQLGPPKHATAEKGVGSDRENNKKSIAHQLLPDPIP
ncbi:hypothetical protein C7212DRAFT_362822 [Tuber magnatum]|uniref:Uncharacterized protein n=1 Tax=Tuber magnatum TaxID=42249 RepID=A0A317SS59_9PEZI|nr:hypothetical protein C7212DRAFT_362822 [Tuber magnatum]